MSDRCGYWDGCEALATHVYGGTPFCGEHDVRTSEEATIDALRTEVERLRSALAKAEVALTQTETQRDEARALLAEAREALTAIARVGYGLELGDSAEDAAEYWASIVSDNRRRARALLARLTQEE